VLDLTGAVYLYLKYRYLNFGFRCFQDETILLEENPSPDTGSYENPGPSWEGAPEGASAPFVA